jgi:hypothetical protein
MKIKKNFKIKKSTNAQIDGLIVFFFGGGRCKNVMIMIVCERVGLGWKSDDHQKN